MTNRVGEDFTASTIKCGIAKYIVIKFPQRRNFLKSRKLTRSTFFSVAHALNSLDSDELFKIIRIRFI